MLTDSEKKWLEERGCRTRKMPLSVDESLEGLSLLLDDLKMILNLAKAKYLQRYYADLFKEAERRAETMTKYIDAALFEARVAAKLANPQWAVCWNSDSCLEFGGSKDEPRWWWNCEWCRLKHARLQVEEEMYAENG